MKNERQERFSKMELKTFNLMGIMNQGERERTEEHKLRVGDEKRERERCLI